MKEVRKILRKLNCQLAPPSKIPRFIAFKSTKDHRKNTLLTRSELSDVSNLKNVERKQSSEELRQDIQLALHLLDEEIANDKNRPSKIRKDQKAVNRKILKTIKVQKQRKTVMKQPRNDDDQPFYEDRWNKGDSPVEMEQEGMDDWIPNFKNDGSILSSPNKINEARIWLNMKENKDTEACEYSKHRVLPASHSHKFYSYYKYSPENCEKQNISPKSLSLNSSLLPNSKKNLSSEYLKYKLRSALGFLDKKTINDKCAADENINYHNEDSSVWFDRNIGIFYDFENQRNDINTKNFKLNSKIT